MAFLGIFGKKSEDSGVRKHAERVANKRAQAFDRWEAIQALAKLKSRASVEALLPRFTFYVEPSITDQEEKDAAFAAVVDAGSNAHEPVRAFLRKAESISWPVKMLDKVMSPELVIKELVELLSGMSTEYERDPERKIQLLATLSERRDASIAAVAVRFLEDSSEPVRFNAASAVLAQGEGANYRDALIECVRAEESVRVRNRILDGFAAAGTSVTPHEAVVQPRLPAGYSLDKAGVPRKKS
jgi:HEAT repeat protein